MDHSVEALSPDGWRDYDYIITTNSMRTFPTEFKDVDGAIETVKTALRARRDAVVAALQREIPEARFSPPSGGYFMWVELPESVDVAELERAAAERDVIFVKGTDFLLEGGSNTLRLAYSGVTPEQIDEGITRLAEALRSLGVAAA